MNYKFSLLLRYGKANASGDKGHRRDGLLLRVPQRAVPHHAGPREGTRVGRGYRECEESPGNGLHCAFRRKSIKEGQQV